MAGVAVEVSGAKLVGDFAAVVTFGDFPREACGGAGNQGMDSPNVGDTLEALQRGLGWGRFGYIGGTCEAILVEILQYALPFAIALWPNQADYDL
jgi:hypothetical protein